MLKKNPQSVAALKLAREPEATATATAPAPGEISETTFEKFAMTHLVREMAKLARIPDSKVGDFGEDFIAALSQWLCLEARRRVLEEDDKLLAQAGFVPLDKFFSDLGSKALALDQQLLELEFQLDLEKKDFRRDFENIASGHIVDFSLRLKNILALARLSHSIADSRAALFIVAGEAETQELKLAQELGSKRGRGRRKGQLPFLVNELELGARCANGGFYTGQETSEGHFDPSTRFFEGSFSG